MSNKRLIIICIVIGIALFIDGFRTAILPRIKETKSVEKQELSLTDKKNEANIKREIESDKFPELKYNYGINKKRIKCINNSNIFERYKCEINASYAWEREIKKSLSLLKAKIDSDEYMQIEENQRLWNKYEEDTEKLIYAYIISKSGNYNMQIGYNYIADMRKQRSELLRKVYNLYSIEEKGKNIKEVNQYIADEVLENENKQINKYLTYLQVKAAKEEFGLAAKNQEIWEQLLESDKRLVHNFMQKGIVSEFSEEEEIRGLYKNRAVLLRRIYNQYYKNTAVQKN